jgi:2-keto-4-pentenoate hydratase/2-oxohepta-3-ene-1,7-dioic acid hydratase in catechol pathway
MRYVTFSLSGDPAPRLGALRGDRVLDLSANGGPPSLLAIIQAGPGVWERARALVEGAGSAGHPLDGVRLHAPIPRPLKNVFCLGLNYAAHAKESAAARNRETKIPEVPVFFSKTPTTVNGPFDDVPVERTVTQQVDWEVELGVIIGTPGRNIRAADALAHVFGYTVINDVSARDVQIAHGGQWFKGKSLDGSCPMGPCVVTAEEFGDPQRKQLQCRINGVVKQDATTADMIFPVATIIEWLSRGMTLEAGDVIATGTPQGVGMGRTPQEFLHDGDLIETEIEGIGTLRNKVVG